MSRLPTTSDSVTSDKHDEATAFASGRKGSHRPEDGGIPLSTLSPEAANFDTRRRSVAGLSSAHRPVVRPAETFSSHNAAKASSSDKDIFITSKELSSSSSPADTDTDSTTPSSSNTYKARQSSVIPTPGFRYRAFLQRHRPWVITGAVIFGIACALIIALTVYFHHEHVLAAELQPPVINVTLTSFNAAANPYNITTPPVRLAALWNFADPTFHHDAETGLWWAFATNGGAGILKLLPTGSNDSAVQTLLNATGTNRRIPNFQVATSPDFANWTVEPAANPLPVLGKWVYGSNITTNSTTSNVTATISLVASTTTTTTTSYPYASTLHPIIAGAPTPLTFPTYNYSANATLSQFGAPPPGPQNITFSTTKGANPWAPEIFRNPITGKWIMYYCATSAVYPDSHCIGASISSVGIAGPYVPQNESIACEGAWGGAIDPAAFIDVDTVSNATAIYLLYKIDGNSHGQGGECYNTIAPQTSTPLLLQRMADDGVTPIGSPTYLLDRETDEGDGPLVEAPSLVKVDGVYVLFYSTGCTRNADYDVRVATATNVTGPYTRRGVLLKSGDYGQLYAPGSVTVRTSVTYQASSSSAADADEMTGTVGLGADGVALWEIMFHARVVTKSGGIRAVFTAGLEFVEEEMQSLSETVKAGSSKQRTSIVRVVQGSGAG